LAEWDKKKNVDGCFSIKLDRCIYLSGDVKIEFVSTLMKHKTKLFHYWFNTFFINETQNCKCGVFSKIPHILIASLFRFFLLIIIAEPDGTVILVLNKKEIDGAHKDKPKVFSDDFRVSE
jgi:phosphatidylinositol-3,4,5-trisphosphate 3-phosphatase and dual-specificity protein phosphatase PTEN